MGAGNQTGPFQKFQPALLTSAPWLLLLLFSPSPITIIKPQIHFVGCSTDSLPRSPSDPPPLPPYSFILFVVIKKQKQETTLTKKSNIWEERTHSTRRSQSSLSLPLRHQGRNSSRNLNECRLATCSTHREAPRTQGTHSQGNAAETTEECSCQAGRQTGISASFFVELRTTCLEKQAAHSGLHPPESVHYQDTPPQTDLRSSLVEAK